MRVGNDLKGKANGQVLLTLEDIDLLLECIWRFTKICDEGMYAYQYQKDLKSAEAMEKQLEFMKKEMQGE